MTGHFEEDEAEEDVLAFFDAGTGGVTASPCDFVHAEIDPDQWPPLADTGDNVPYWKDVDPEEERSW